MGLYWMSMGPCGLYGVLGSSLGSLWFSGGSLCVSMDLYRVPVGSLRLFMCSLGSWGALWVSVSQWGPCLWGLCCISMGPGWGFYGSFWVLAVCGGMKGRCPRPLTPGPSPRPPPAVPRRRRRAVPAQFRSVAAGGAAERRAPRNGRSEIAAALRRAARGRLRVQRAALEAGHGVATPSLRRSSTWPRPHLRCFSAWGRGLDLIPPTMGVALLKGAWLALATPPPSRLVLG